VPNEKLTVGYIDHNPEIFAEFLGKSLTAFDASQYEVLSTTDKDCPSKNYNSILERSANRYVVLVHYDVLLPTNFLDAVHNTVEQHPDFGVLGLVGFFPFENHNRLTIGATVSKPCLVDFFDPLCILVNKDNALKFDEVEFDGLHLYVEDYCMQAIEKGLKNYTVLLDITTVQHLGNTYSKSGQMWGDYSECYWRFMKKWSIRLSRPIFEDLPTGRRIIDV